MPDTAPSAASLTAQAPLQDRSPSSPAPRATPGPVAALRADLEAADYTSARIEQLLGAGAAAALRREHALPALRVLADTDEAAGLLFSVFTLGRTATAAQLEPALPRLGLDGAVELGLLGPAETGQEPGASAAPTWRALVDLAPYAAEDDQGAITWWIASDLSELATGRPLGTDHVLGVGGASLTLARLTPRRRVERVLDLGCGCGIQALHASRHAQTVVATDLSERALAFAAFNAALNGVELDLRAGSLFDPVGTERFDLVVSNPPFVITPRDGTVAEWTYRDGGQRGDTLLAHVVEGLEGHLRPGGTAVMLANWEISAPEPWQTHPAAWLDRTGLDAWVIQREREDPAQYAETWARDGGITERDARWAPMVSAWLDDFASRAVDAIGFGYLLARRPASPGRPPARLFEEVLTTGTGSLGAHLAQGLDRLAQLAALDDDALGAAFPVRADDVVERRHLTPGAWDPLLIELVQGAGFGRTVTADQLLAATVGASDGELTVDQILGAVCALTDADVAEARGRLLPELRELVRTGMLDLEHREGAR
ncbi:methyltransferase [Brachybacterium huguangmaarense]|uniref:Methyltransferase n=1 Tax=Brachybacterium huguangmaarense TaxID=1652028 RepID=A0ABY6G5R1_9MICO|nr:methyltransferase [Brachybacterium huguangmaarense]UYG17974.1 methyltransferase [Brachybacterium huguangmaarense]